MDKLENFFDRYERERLDAFKAELDAENKKYKEEYDRRNKNLLRYSINWFVWYEEEKTLVLKEGLVIRDDEIIIVGKTTEKKFAFCNLHYRKRKLYYSDCKQFKMLG